MMLLVSSFYRLFAISGELQQLSTKSLQELAKEHAVRGLIIVSPEGINGTVAGGEAEIPAFMRGVEEYFQIPPLDQKLSRSSSPPFRRFVVKVRPEIVTSAFQTKDEILRSGSNRLSPQEWQSLLTSGEEVTVLDVRNSYEVAIGRFRGAIDPRLEQFTQFGEFLRSAALPRERKTLIYCTGGIRCEKAYFELQEAGFEEVYQLEGGILRYLEHFPNAEFEGECFVFDDRVALNQELEPTGRYEFCPKCGSPAERSDEGSPNCVFCEQSAGDLS